MNFIKSLFAAILLVDGLFFVLALNSDHPSTWFREDGPIENLTAMLLICTFLFAMKLLFFGKIATKRYRRWLVLFSAIGLLGFLDELSYGERIFGFEFPVVNGVKLDALHDLNELAVRTAGNNIADYALIFSLILLSAIVLLGVLVKRSNLQIWETIKVDRAFPLYVVVLAIGGISVITMLNDAHVVQSLYFPGFIEELLELNVSIALFSCCIFINMLETLKIDATTESV